MAGDYTDAAAFLSSVLPWPVEGQPFVVNIHRRMFIVDQNGKQLLDTRGKPRVAFPGRAARTVAEAISYIKFTEGISTSDTYVCMSGQLPGRVKTNRRGGTYYSAVRSSDAAQCMKGLWIDVDVKPNEPSKGYATTLAAAQEFDRIRRAVGMPVPTMSILSGSGGFHGHWVFDAAVAPSEWEPLALALVAAFVEHGFKGDTGCTIDAARILRIPGTWNHKQVDAGTGPKTPVSVAARSGLVFPVTYIKNILSKWVGAVPHRARRSVLMLTGQMPDILRDVHADDLAAGIEDARPSPSVVDVAKVCPFINRTLHEGGKTNNNFVWMQTTTLALFTSEGRDAAHWLACQHPTYSVETTDEMVDRKKVDISRGLGWPQCRSFAANGGTECATCEHFAKNKSPLNFVKCDNAVTVALAIEAAPPVVNAAAQAALGPLPNGYTWGPEGIVMISRLEDNGNITKEPLTLNPILNAWIQDQPAVVNFTTVIAGQVGKADALYRQIRMPQALIHDASNMGKQLAEQGMLVNPNRLIEFKSFMASYTEILRRNRENVVQSAPFGWFRQDGKTVGFIYNKQIWNNHKPRPASNPDPMLDRTYSPTGTLEPWMTAAKMVTDQNRPEFDAILASAFGAPLVGCVGQTGLLMSTYSPESGIGKSTAIRVAQAVWGHPVRSVQSLGDTQNSVVKKMGDIRSLPMYWDELKTDVDHQKFVSLAFQLAQGKEKSRLASDTTYREPGTWETMLVSCSNDSLINYILGKTRTTSAGLARIFEFRIEPPREGRIDIGMAQQIVAALNDNYGCAGLVYAKFLGREHVNVNAEVMANLLELEKTFKVSTEERFWLSLVTCILMGAHYANRLKLTNINHKRLRDFMYAKFDDMRRERSESASDITSYNTLLNHVGRYLNERRMRHTLVTNAIWTLSGKPPVHPSPGGIRLLSDPGGRIEQVQIQVGIDTKQIRFVKAPFVRWLRENELSDRLVLQEMARQFNMKEIRGRLGAGTPFLTAIEPVLDMDLSKVFPT